jgi:murein DD-endopeptidase MepM/ murein hydrolase activator NlpD
LLLIVLFGASAFSTIARADLVSDVQAQIDEVTRQRAAIEADIAAYQKQLNVLGTQRQTLSTAIKSIDVTRNATQSQINATQNKLTSTNLKLNQLSFQIADKEDVIELDRAAIAKALRDIAATDETTLIEAVFAEENLSEAWTMVDASTALSQSLHDHAARLSGDKAQLTVQKLSVDDQKKQLAALNKELAAQKRQLDIAKAEKDKLLSATKSQESTYQSLIAQKRAEEASFEATLFRLASQLKYAADPSLAPPSKGVLSWPLDKVTITQQFGITADSGRLYASGSHDGIDLGAPTGTPIRAALGGTVYEINQGAVQNCQYGKWVIVKHPNGLATLYAHMSVIEASKGQTVSTGQVIGYVGMTGYATGPHLHFTVYDGAALTLRQYTCKAGPTVTIPIAPPKAYLNPMSYL